MTKNKRMILFLGVIYLTFISLGLPDSVIGVAWPVIHKDIHSNLSAAGLIAMAISICTVISSLQTARLIRKFGTAKLVIFSVLLTAAGLIGFSFTSSYLFFIVFAFPLGLGAGAIDTALNDYVALNFKAHHMNWLHGFWGIGATLGPMIMGAVLLKGASWRTGYLLLSGIQFFLAVVLCFSLPLWSKEDKTPAPLASKKGAADEKAERPLKLREVLNIPGVKFSVLSFIFYVGIEASMGLWGSSYLIAVKGIEVGQASFIVSAFYASLTVGRMLTGFITFWLSNQRILFLSELFILLGVGIVFISPGYFTAMLGFIITGLGCAAIFPTMLHETPSRFGSQNSGAVMGVQIGLAYVGTAGLPFLLGMLSNVFNLSILTAALFLFGLILLFSTIQVEKTAKERRATNDYNEESDI
ncbi:MFS transporter [Enterococcus sp. LJL51]|uniref:MFS transporter n=1 Tax=Enterococcus sp. LJL51 TaxID=3416656 RepID=UPI003CF49D8F